MKHKQLIAVLGLMLLVGLAALAQMPLAGNDQMHIAVAPGAGFAVLSQNPLTVERGETAVFEIEVAEGYAYSGVSAGTYEDGKLTVSNVQAGQTLYLHTLKYCEVTVDSGEHGTARLTQSGTFLQGQEVQVQVLPEDNYVVGNVTVNGKAYPAPTGDTFTFTVEDDSRVQVDFAGRPVNITLVSGNLGQVSIENTVDTYRYGDQLELTGEYDPEHIVFAGWSRGNYLDEGGVLVSDKLDFSYKVFDDTILYANFRDRSAYALSFDANGGTITDEKKIKTKEYAPGAFVNVPLSDGSFQREGYTLMGFSTKRNNGEVISPGSMLLMPREETILYAQWAENTPLEHLDYQLLEDGVLILGLSEKGKQEQVQTLVIPQTIKQRQVIAIAESAFYHNTYLEKVVLPVGLQTIGAQAFGKCPALKVVYFPETLTVLTQNAFADCQAFTQMRVIASMDRVFDYDYDSALADKYMRLKHTPGKRIVLVGGSSLAFGMDSQILQDKFPDYTVINMGVSMHYGILPTFDILRENIREGDIVIFCPEFYVEMYGVPDTQRITNWQYLESNYDILADINLQRNPLIINKFSSYLGTKHAYLPGKHINTNPVYVRSGFNQFGDLILERNPMGAEGPGLPYQGLLTDLGMANYNTVCRELTEKGARCCFSFPPQPIGGYSKESLQNQLVWFQQELEGKLDSRYCTVISKVWDYFFAGNIFYDSKYHMTLEGAKVRTQQLTADLATYLGGAE